jgi:hypothetical protein
MITYSMPTPVAADAARGITATAAVSAPELVSAAPAPRASRVVRAIVPVVAAAMLAAPWAVAAVTVAAR